MENQVIRIGSVGVGGIWSGVHEPGIRKSPNLELVAICDIDREKLDAVGEKYGIPAERRFTDYHDLIRCPDVDAVDICTSNDAHLRLPWQQSRPASRTIWKKPITMTAAQAKQLAQATRVKALPNMVCFRTGSRRRLAMRGS